MDAVQPGRTLGPYRIISRIGQGGMATVYKAYHAAMDRHVAIKVLPSQLADSPEFVARFQQEARTIAKLEHTHILPVYDYGETDGIMYLVMRYLDAGMLNDRIEAGLIPLPEIDRLFTQLADALTYAHNRGVVHRDLKPSNVLLDAEGSVFLSDFGIAKILESSQKLTATGGMIGTPAYMSPEQARGNVVDRRSDLYSLGIILYEMVTGRLPFEAETPMAVMLKQITADLPLPSSAKPDIPPAIEQTLLKALAKDPADRFASAAEFASAWKRALSPNIEASPPIIRTGQVPTRSAVRPATSKPRTSWLISLGAGLAACLCLAVGLSGGAVFLRSQTAEDTGALSLSAGPPTIMLTVEAVMDKPAPTATVPQQTLAPTPLIPTSTPAPLQTESVTLQNEEGGFQTGVTLSFVADVWGEPRVGDPGVSGDRQTQLILGEHVLILGETDFWYYIVAVEQPSSKDSHGYPGWVQKSDIVEGWPLASEYAIVAEPIASLFISPDGRRIGEVPFDARLPVLEKQAQWVHVYLPDRSDGWLSLDEVRITADVSEPYKVDEIVSTADKFIGSPYLWGGTTTRGFDCSGFLYRVFHMHGITLSRDSRDMALNGIPVSRDALQVGDIVFTSSRPDGVVSHTALYIGEGQIIETIGTDPVGIQTLTQLLSIERFVNARHVIP